MSGFGTKVTFGNVKCPLVLLVLGRSHYLLLEWLEVLAASWWGGHSECMSWKSSTGRGCCGWGEWWVQHQQLEHDHMSHLVCVVLDYLLHSGCAFLISWQTSSWTCQWVGDIRSSDRQGSILSSMATCECGVPVGYVSAIYLQQASSWTSLEIGTPEAGEEAGIWPGVLGECAWACAWASRESCACLH